jgi:MinD-like ATPase involved in chromosome partitioning or flagellar assembly
VVQVLLAATGEAWEADVVRSLSRPGSPMVLVRRCMDVADAVATAASGQAEVVLVGRALPGLDSDVVARLVEAGAVPVGVVDDTEGADARSLEAMGVDCLLVWSELEELPGVLDRHRARGRVPVPDARPPAGDEAFGVDGSPMPTGQLVAVWGPTGAPGRSTVALGLAAELSSRGVPTLLIDMDVYGGAVAQMLAMLDEISGLLATARLASTGQLTLGALHEHVREVNPCLRVLTGLPRADRWPQLRPSALTGLLSVARRMAPVVVLDCGFNLESDEELSFDTAAPRRNGATLAALERADRVLVVGSAEPLGLARLARAVLDLTAAVPGCDASLVVNRVRSGLGWSTAEVGATVQRFTGRTPLAYLPEDRPAVDRTWVAGKTLPECAPDSALRRALAAMATEVTGFAAAAPPRRMLRRRTSH